MSTSTTTIKPVAKMSKAELLEALAGTAEPSVKETVAGLRKMLRKVRQSNGAATPRPRSERPTTTPEAEAASSDRVERLDLGKAEHEAMKAWKKAGSKGEPPATPNLDAMAAKAPTTTAGKAATSKATPPPVGVGYVAIPIRGRTLLATVESVRVAGAKLEAEHSRIILAVENVEAAQKLVTSLRKATVDAKEHVAWLLESLISHVRCEFSTTTDEGTSVNTRAVNALVASGKAWVAEYRASDGSPVYRVEGAEPVSARAVLKLVPAVEAPAA